MPFPWWRCLGQWAVPGASEDTAKPSAATGCGSCHTPPNRVGDPHLPGGRSKRTTPGSLFRIRPGWFHWYPHSELAKRYENGTSQRRRRPPLAERHRQSFRRWRNSSRNTRNATTMGQPLFGKSRPWASYHQASTCGEPQVSFIPGGRNGVPQVRGAVAFQHQSHCIDSFSLGAWEAGSLGMMNGSIRTTPPYCTRPASREWSLACWPWACLAASQGDPASPRTWSPLSLGGTTGDAG
ncbi:hypothetical protein QBC39DRAFT_35803 [Podospora conica]|nr:hypothetical protein QBC39DRAFT_35803 [Schizothecium conicum]